MNKEENRPEFVRRRDEAIRAFVMEYRLLPAIRLFIRYRQPLPEDARVLKIALCWAAQETDQPEEIRRRASMLCLAMGVPDRDPGRNEE